MKEKIDILLREPLLDDWSRGFLESIRGQLEKEYTLSERQKATFNKIQSRFSPQEKEKLEHWAEEYRTEHKEKAKIIATYYSYTTYFEDMATKILQDEEYVPQRHRYKQMSENKYAEGVYKNATGVPKFADGEMVQIRKYGDCHADRIGYVLNSQQPVKTHAKGGKSYLILLFGTTTPIIREERQLKKPNKNGRRL
tara:strand:- start:2480 stop:3067 length:588 start_codon:yes stop_codon:yes gene_type:complete